MALGKLTADSDKDCRLTVSVGVFVLTVFLSAFLLFSIQPMFTKMVLPVLGGSPSVWSVAMVVFQSLLLAGYGYAHWLARWPSLKAASLFHLAVMASALLAMPITVAARWSQPPTESAYFWLLSLFVASIGLPFFTLAANGPLLQAWFCRTRHADAHDPYFLYVASNLGSFVALLAYPIVVEPILPLSSQSLWWSVGFVVLAVLIGSCARRADARPRARPPITGSRGREIEEPLPSWSARLCWVVLSFVPSALLVAVTAHISTDVAAVPLLWVIPLALYLLSLVIAFQQKMIVSEALLWRVQAGTAALTLISAQEHWPFLPVAVAVPLLVFVTSAVICHRALYGYRPPASHLTDFYLSISFGGAIGGVFCGLLAPQMFGSVLEYPVLIIAALFCRPGFFRVSKRLLRSAAIVLLIGSVAALGGYGIATVLPPDLSRVCWYVLLGGFALIVMAEWRVPHRMAPIALLLGILTIVPRPGSATPELVRSFFGVHKIALSGDQRFRLLFHGTTLHGAMRVRNDDGTPALEGRPEPTTYYSYDGAIGRAIAAVREARGGTVSSAAAIGLGTGSLACHKLNDETWTFFEIDPAVARIAQDPSRFRFLSECAPEAQVVLGDARLTISDRPDRYGVIIVDAFSSDSIPVHLITKEALGIYLSKLDDRGAIVFHISNRHLNLDHILARAAAEHGLVTYVEHYSANEPLERRYRLSSIVATLARDANDLGSISSSGEWSRVNVDYSRTPWTDDYSNVVEAILATR